MGQPWNSEVLVARTLKLSGVNLIRAPAAYCKQTSLGECRYFGELARSWNLMPNLLEVYPSAAGLICKAAIGPCGPGVWNTSSADMLDPHFQTRADREQDPYWCKLLDRLQSVRACPNGWGGQLKLQH